MPALHRLAVVLLATALPGVTAAQQPQPPSPDHLNPEGPRAIRVTGEGEVEVAPDMARVVLAVETTGASAESAGKANATRMAAVTGALQKAGIRPERIETGRYELLPNYPPPDPRAQPGQPAKPTSYRAMNTIEVTQKDLTRVGEVIDRALGAGANRVEQVAFEIEDPTRAQGRALQEAVGRARVQAGVLAQSLGVELGPVLEASTSAGPSPPVPVTKEAAVVPGAPTTPIEPQAQKITASVTLVYGIGS